MAAPLGGRPLVCSCVPAPRSPPPRPCSPACLSALGTQRHCAGCQAGRGTKKLPPGPQTWCASLHSETEGPRGRRCPWCPGSCTASQQPVGRRVYSWPVSLAVSVRSVPCAPAARASPSSLCLPGWVCSRRSRPWTRGQCRPWPRPGQRSRTLAERSRGKLCRPGSRGQSGAGQWGRPWVPPGLAAVGLSDPQGAAMTRP